MGMVYMVVSSKDSVKVTTTVLLSEYKVQPLLTFIC